jgi:short-subunit dehydrogenase
MNIVKPICLIVGVGDGLSASLARLFYRENYELVLASRDVTKLSQLATETEATTVSCDATKADAVEELFATLDKTRLDVVIYNPSRIVRGPIAEVDPGEVHKALDVTAFGSFLVAQQAAKAMLERSKGTIIFTGASAGVKGFPKSAAFAMGKHAQKGLAESMARELHPQNIHVCWVNIDGGIRNSSWKEPSPDSTLDPDAIALEYLHIVQQHRSVWSNERSLRPWVEKW